jgi:hypothetical protein
MTELVQKYSKERMTGHVRELPDEGREGSSRSGGSS